MSRRTVLTDAVALSAAERLDLMTDIWNSLLIEGDLLPTTPEQKAELDRRRAAYDADVSQTLPWSEAAEELERDL